MPSIRLVCRRRGLPIDLAALRSSLPDALASVEALTEPELQPLPEEIVVMLVSDVRMAEMHSQYSGVSGPTDVLTFQHGDIVVSVDTAAREAKARGFSLEQELLRYIVHGLLHLRGFDDTSPALRKVMINQQEQLLKKLQ